MASAGIFQRTNSGLLLDLVFGKRLHNADGASSEVRIILRDSTVARSENSMRTSVSGRHEGAFFQCVFFSLVMFFVWSLDQT